MAKEGRRRNTNQKFHENRMFLQENDVVGILLALDDDVVTQSVYKNGRCLGASKEGLAGQYLMILLRLLAG